MPSGITKSSSDDNDNDNDGVGRGNGSATASNSNVFSINISRERNRFLTDVDCTGDADAFIDDDIDNSISAGNCCILFVDFSTTFSSASNSGKSKSGNSSSSSSSLYDVSISFSCVFLRRLFFFDL